MTHRAMNASPANAHTTARTGSARTTGAIGTTGDPAALRRAVQRRERWRDLGAAMSLVGLAGLVFWLLPPALR